MAAGIQTSPNRSCATAPIDIELSIIIINWNTAHLLKQTIESVYENALGVSNEIIVVDNASSDNSVELLLNQFRDVKLIANKENIGFSRAANIGLCHASGKFILVGHADIRFMPAAIERMVSFLSSHSQAGIVGANLLYPDGSYNSCSIRAYSSRRLLIDFFFFSLRDVLKYFDRAYDKLHTLRESYFWNHTRTQESDMVWNACMMFKRDILTKIHGFSDDFFVWFADVDFCYRAKKAGWESYYLADAKVIHYERKSEDFIRLGSVQYKLDSYYVQDEMNRDMATLIGKHHGYLCCFVQKATGIALSLARHLKRIISGYLSANTQRSVGKER